MKCKNKKCGKDLGDPTYCFPESQTGWKVWYCTKKGCRYAQLNIPQVPRFKIIDNMAINLAKPSQVKERLAKGLPA